MLSPDLEADFENEDPENIEAACDVYDRFFCDCGMPKTTFMHNCKAPHTEEITGCPMCDDECGFCKETP